MPTELLGTSPQGRTTTKTSGGTASLLSRPITSSPPTTTTTTAPSITSTTFASASGGVVASSSSPPLLVHFGDLITLTSERQGGGYMQLRGITDRSIVVQSQHHRPREKSTFKNHFERCIFEILPTEAEESSAMEGSVLRYGQMVRLRSNYVTRANASASIMIRRRQHAILDPKCVRVQIASSSSSSASGTGSETAKQQAETRSMLFRVMPRYKVRNIGERVRYGDRILFECGSLQQQYLSTSARAFSASSPSSLTLRSTTLSSYHEVLASDLGDTWTINAFDTDHKLACQTSKKNKGHQSEIVDFDDGDDETDPTVHLASQHRSIHACEPVVIFHKEAEGLITVLNESAQELENSQVKSHPEVAMNLLDVPQNFDIQSLHYSSNSLWIVELEENIRGGTISWNTRYRLRHVASGRYLSVMRKARNQQQTERMNEGSTEDTTLVLTTVTDPLVSSSGTIFSMDRFDLLDDRLSASSFLRLFNVKYQVFLTAENNATIQHENDREFQPIHFSREPLYADVFVIHPASREELGGLHQIAEAAPVLQNITMQIQSYANEHAQHDSKNAEDNTDELIQIISPGIKNATALLTHLIISCFGGSHDKIQDQITEATQQVMSDKEINLVLDFTGVPVRKSQALLVDQSFHKRVLAFLMSLQRHKSISLKSLSTLSKFSRLFNLARLSYKLLMVMTQDSPDLALHLQGDIGFMISQLGYGLYAAETLRMMFTNNLLLLSLLQSQHVKTMVGLLADKKQARYLSFLESLCICNGKPVMRNQNTVLRLLFPHDDDAKDNSEDASTPFGVLPRQTLYKDGALHIKNPVDNSSGHWIPLLDFDKGASEKHKEFLEHTISLYATLCRGGNAIAIAALEPIISREEIMHVVFDQSNANVSIRLRSSYLSLLITLYVDREENDMSSGAYHPTDDSAAIIWDSFGKEEEKQQPDERKTGANDFILSLKPHIRNYFHDSSGMRRSQAVVESEQNRFTTLMIELFKNVMSQGAFGQDELKPLLLPMIQVLNGKNDVYSNDPAEQAAHKDYDRFESNMGNNYIMQSKTFMCQTISQILDNQIVANANLILSRFKAQIEEAHARRRYADINLTLPEISSLREVCHVDDFLDKDSDGGDDKFVSVLLHLLQYENNDLVNASFGSLFKIVAHLQEVTCRLRKTTLLLTKESVGMHHTFIQHIESLKRFERVDQDGETVMNGLRDLENSCVDRNSRKRRPYLENQRMLLHLGTHDIIIDLIRMVVGDSSEQATQVLQACVDFLRAFCRKNLQCQLALFPHLEFIVSTLEMRVVYGPLFEEIFRNNRELCEQCPEQLIWHIVSLISQRGCLPRLLKFLKSIVRCSNTAIPQNQILVMKYLMEQAHDTMVLLNNFDHEKEIMKNLQDSNYFYDRESENLVAYHLELVATISNCCRGLVSHTEIQAQALIPLDVILDKVISKREMPIFFRYRYLKYLDEVYITTGIDIEKLLNSSTFSRVLGELLRDVQGMTPRINALDDTLENGFSVKRYIYKGILNCVTAMLRRNAQLKTHTQTNSTAASVLEDLIAAFCHETFCRESKQPYVDLLLSFALVAEKCGYAGKVMRLRDALEDTRNRLLNEASIGTGSTATLSWEEEVREFIAVEYTQFVKQCEDVFAPLSFKDPETLSNSPNSLLMIGGFHHLAQVLLRNLQLSSSFDKSTKHTPIASVFFSHLRNASLSDQHRIDIMLTAQQMLRSEEVGNEQIHALQRSLTSFGLCGTLVDLIDSKNVRVVATSIDTLILLLEAGADNISGVSQYVQRALYRYLLVRKDVTLFDSLSKHLQQAIDLVIKTQTESTLILREQEHRAEAIQLATRVLRLLQLFCEGHYQSMQNYVRQQMDNLTSHDLVTITAELFKVLAADDLRSDTAECILQTINTLIDYCQGPCKENQMALVAAGVCGPANVHILGGSDHPEFGESLKKNDNRKHYDEELDTDSDKHDISDVLEEIQAGSVTLLLSLMEGRTISDRFILSTVFNSLSLDAMFDCMNNFYRGEESQCDLSRQLFIMLQILGNFDESGSVNRRLESDFAGYRTFSSQVATIEILRNNNLETLWFHIPKVCHSISSDSKEHFFIDVDRSNQVSKLQGLLEESDHLIFEAELQHNLHKELIAKEYKDEQRWNLPPWFIDTGRYAYRIAVTREPFLNDISLSLSMMINFLLIYFVRATDESGINSFEMTSSMATMLLYVFSIAHVVTQLLLGLHFAVARLPIIHHHYEQEKDDDIDDGDNESHFKDQSLVSLVSVRVGSFVKSVAPPLLLDPRLHAVMSNSEMIFQILSLVFSICGLLINPFFFAVHLFELIRRSPLLQNVISAVTSNGRSLLLTTLLGMVIVYTFTALGFLFHRDKFSNDDFGEGINFCSDLYQCFLFTLSNGIRSGGGIGELLVPPDWRTEHIPLSRVIFDTAFFAVVIVILMNILFGQIIDTFAESRDEKRAIEEDMKSKCFICGIDSKMFDQRAQGFDHHVRVDHNVWNYVYFMHHLRKKPASEYTGQETYVQQMLAAGNLSFFPINRAMALEHLSRQDARSSGNGAADHQSTGAFSERSLSADPITSSVQSAEMENTLLNHLQRMESRINSVYEKQLNMASRIQAMERRGNDLSVRSSAL